ncbi:MAG: metallophosphoesterase [Bacteroidota bacterium]|nr:metallophosphoesterase [Bacteroidota bacterium]
MKIFSALLLCLVAAGYAQTDSSIIFVSDTQQPLWIETLRLKYTDNEKATRLIYTAIEKESTAVAVFHLGDVTSIGMFDSYWHAFDDFQKSEKAPIYPVIGNHDYFIFSAQALEQFHKRFPKISATWYSIVIKNIALIALNSNFSKLTEEEQAGQQSWYQEQLGRFDNDSTIRSVVVLCHHSPYTNSTIVSPNEEVQKEFVSPFMADKKCKIFISGHAHTYEHFQKDGKDFLVIGGGGGLLHPLMQDKEERFNDFFSNSMSPRFFHYVACEIHPASLQFYIKKLQNDFSGFDSVDSVSVPLQ